MFKFLEKISRPLRKKEALAWIASERDRALKDMHKTGDMDSFHYYSGLVDAYNEVLSVFGRKGQAYL